MRTILVIDDEAPIRRAVRTALGDGDTRVVEAADAESGLAAAAAERPDLIVLDLALPDRDGIGVCRDIRAWWPAPILVLSARHADDEKVAALDAGADDYMTKPFSLVELQARVRALLRRAVMAIASSPSLTAGHLIVDLQARSVTRGGIAVHLTPIEWNLLKELIRHAGRTLTHNHLFRAVWSDRSHGDAQQYLRVHVAHLRRKLEEDPIRPRHILTEPAVGYRFET